MPYQGQSLLEFVVTEQGKFSGSAVFALSSCSFFEGALDLRSLDQPTGQLLVKVGWQHVSSGAGEDLVRDCFFNSLDG